MEVDRRPRQDPRERPAGGVTVTTRLIVLVAGVAGGLVAALLALRRLDVVEVSGDSMAPTLLAGDRLLVESLSYRRRAPRRGEIVLAPDPRQPARELIKRVAATGRRVELRGDAPGRSTDSRVFGDVPASRIRWRAALCLWPPQRFGRIAAAPLPGG